LERKKRILDRDNAEEEEEDEELEYGGNTTAASLPTRLSETKTAAKLRRGRWTRRDWVYHAV